MGTTASKPEIDTVLLPSSAVPSSTSPQDTRKALSYSHPSPRTASPRRHIPAVSEHGRSQGSHKSFHKGQLSTGRSPSNFFHFLGPAFFSPSVPISISDAWTSAGGTFIPTLPALLLAHQKHYLNIPKSTLDALHTLLDSSSIVFVIPSDPLLYFIQSSVSLVDPRWILDSINAGKMLDMEDYRVELPPGQRDQVGEVQRMLDQLVGGIRSPDRTPPVRSAHQMMLPSSPITENAKAVPVVVKRKAKSKLKSGKKRYILQPYLRLADPSNPSRIAAISQAAPPRLYQPNAASPTRSTHLNLTHPHLPHPDATSKILPVPPGFTIPNLPILEFKLETDLAPDFRLDRLDEAQMSQLMTEIVQDASEEMKGDLRYWDVRDGSGEIEGREGGEEEEEEEEEEVVEPEEGGRMREVDEEQGVEEALMLDDRRPVRPVADSRPELSTRDHSEYAKPERKVNVHRRPADVRYDPRLSPITPTPKRAPIRASGNTPTYPYPYNSPATDRPRRKEGRKRSSATDEKKENRVAGGMCRMKGDIGGGPGPRTLALTTRNLQRHTQSMEEDEMKEVLAGRGGGGAMMEGMPGPSRVGAQAGKCSREVESVQTPIKEGRKRPIWKDYQAEKRFKIG